MGSIASGRSTLDFTHLKLNQRSFCRRATRNNDDKQRPTCELQLCAWASGHLEDLQDKLASVDAALTPSEPTFFIDLRAMLALLEEGERAAQRFRAVAHQELLRLSSKRPHVRLPASLVEPGWHVRACALCKLVADQ